MSKRKRWKTVARRFFGKRAGITIGDGSDGQYAVVTPCRGVDFSLWQTKEAAEKFKGKLDRGGCCGGCSPKLHYIVDLASVALSEEPSFR